MKPGRVAETLRLLRKRLGGLFAPRRPVPREQVLSAQLLNDLFLGSFPVLFATVLVRLGLGIPLTETASFTLLALIAAGLLGALVLRSGRVYLSGFLLAFSLWAAGTFIAWTYFGTRDATAFIPLFAVLIAFVVLPWQTGLLLSILNVGSIWLYVARELRGVHRSEVALPLDAGLTFTTILALVSLLAFVFGQILHRAVRRTIATQQALSSSEKELSSILQRTPDIIYRLDPEGRIRYVNDAVRRYGYEPSEMMGTHLINYVVPDDRDLALHRVNERRTGERSTEAFEIRLLSRRGRERVAEYTTVPVFQEPVFLFEAEGLYESSAGSAAGYVGTQGIARDITDRKQAEEALRKSEEKYSKVFQAAPAGFIVATLDGARILDVNEEFERISGYRREELVQRSASELGLWAIPRDRERVLSLLRVGRSAMDVETQGYTKAGELRTVRCNAQRVEIAGIPCLLLAVQDITDQRHLEAQLQQAQKLEAIGRMAGGIAHDFNNLLTVIAGRAEMASNELSPAGPAYESIQEIRAAAERSSELTRQLLIFARGQAGAPQVLNLNEAISERLGMLQRLAGDSVQLKWGPAPDLWAVKMDSIHVDQILVNLVANARDAMVDVGTLTISTENWIRDTTESAGATEESTADWVRVIVADTGSGMSNETLAHIFEPFYTTKELGKGTGMGLATVHGIVQQNGGRIEVESVPGKGTTFRICLPRTREVPSPRKDGNPRHLIPGRETVMVVDDEPSVLRFVRKTLQQLGYSVIVAESAMEALSLAARRRETLHLLLTDVVMPEMNGRDLHARLVAFHPETKVIFMSGYSAPAGNGPVGDDGSLLKKPFSIHQLSTRVREVLDQRPDAMETGPHSEEQEG